MRITGGVYRSRQLRAPRGTSTRPTSDRVREALFSILAARRSLEGTRVLDLYAGTGALALEALSRGAAEATVVESAREALAALRANVAALGVEKRTRVVASTVDRAAGALEGSRFDVVFADPPYADVREGRAGRSIERILAVPGAISEGALVVLEHASADPPPDLERADRLETRRYGDTALSIYAIPESPGLYSPPFEQG